MRRAVRLMSAATEPLKSICFFLVKVKQKCVLSWRHILEASLNCDNFSKYQPKFDRNSSCPLNDADLPELRSTQGELEFPQGIGEAPRLTLQKPDEVQ